MVANFTHLLIVTTNYAYTYVGRNIFNTIKTSGHSSFEKYTSHFIERVRKGYERYYCVRGELETEQNCNILAPTLMAITMLLSRSPGLLNRGPGGPASAGTWFSFQHPLSNWSSLQLIWTSCRRSYITIWRPPTFCKRHNFTLNSTQSRSPLISWYLRPDAPVIYTGAFLLLTAWPESEVNMQHL